MSTTPQPVHRRDNASKAPTGRKVLQVHEPPHEEGQEDNGLVSSPKDAGTEGYTLPALNPAALRHWRVSHGYTAEELGIALGVAEQTINRWERGEQAAPWRMLQLALHGLVFTHGPTCRCSHPRCRYQPNRYAANGRAYDPH